MAQGVSAQSLIRKYQSCALRADITPESVVIQYSYRRSPTLVSCKHRHHNIAFRNHSHITESTKRHATTAPRSYCHILIPISTNFKTLLSPARLFQSKISRQNNGIRLTKSNNVGIPCKISHSVYLQILRQFCDIVDYSTTAFKAGIYIGHKWKAHLERAMRFELTTPTLARLCSTTELRPLKDVMSFSDASE